MLLRLVVNLKKTGKSYKFDVALHEMDGLDCHDTKVKIFKELGVFDNVKFVKIPEFYNFDNSRINITIPTSYEGAKKVLIKNFPHEKRGINTFFRHVKGVRRGVYFFSILNSLSRGSKLKKFLLFFAITATPLPLFILFYLFRNSYITVGERLKKCIKDKDLQTLLMANISYYSDDPFNTNMVFFSAAQGGYFEGAYNIDDGGGQRLSNYFWKLIGQNGGTRMLNTIATKILVNDEGSVSGVVFRKCENGVAIGGEKTVSTYAVVSGADPYQTADMLPDKFGDKLRDSVKDVKISSSLSSIYFGMKTQMKDSLNSKYYSNFVFHPDFSGIESMNQKSIMGKYETIPFVFLDSSVVPFKHDKHKYLCTAAVVDYIEHWEKLSPQEYAKEKQRDG